MKIHLDSPPEEVQIQIIPLIDVIFCILTFFILAALQLTRPQSIAVDLPQAKTGVPQMRQNIVVTISPSGQVFIDKDPIGVNQLYAVLQDYVRNNPQGLLVLNASQTALYSDVVQVLDIMRLVGGDRVALATQQPTGSQLPGLPNPSPTPFDPLNPSGIPTPNSTFNPDQFQFPPGGSSPVPNVSPTVPGFTPDLFPGQQNTTPNSNSVTPAPNPTP
jgi:biopolymer transport protein ExbD